MRMECDESGFGTWFPLQQACLAAILPKALLGTQATGRLNNSCFARCWLTRQGQHWKAEAELFPVVRSLGFTKYGIVTFTGLDWDLGLGGSLSFRPYYWPTFWGPDGLGYYGPVQFLFNTQFCSTCLKPYKWLDFFEWMGILGWNSFCIWWHVECKGHDYTYDYIQIER